MKANSPVHRRLDGYWKMEGACALIFPPLALLLATPADAVELGVLALALLACCAMLVVGTLYWRAALHRAQGEAGAMRALMPWAARLQGPTLALGAAALAAAIWLAASRAMDRATGAAIGFAVLAALEYVNYYHVQLQNFDHWPDFRRFVAERRFRRSHMADDLRHHRRRRGRARP